MPRDLQTSVLRDQRAVLKEKIQSWQQLRTIYMPGLLQVLIDIGADPILTWDSNLDPEAVDLWLPSAIPKERRRAACREGIPEMELKLRTAQCSGSLQSLRHVLRLKTRMVYFKNKNIRGQREGTRSRAIIDRVHKRAIRLVHKYRSARNAKLELEGPGEWEATFQVLRNEDVRGYASGTKKKGPGRRGIWEDGHEPPAEPRPSEMLESDESESEESELDIEMEDGVRLTDAQLLKARKKGTGETRKEISWIWRTTRMNFENGDAADDILRSEWARSRARCHRAREEVELLVEEMRRVLEFLEWRARWWEVRGSRMLHVSADLAEGLRSYAEDQANLQKALAASFRHLWMTPLRKVDDTLKVADTGDGEDGAEGIDDDEDDEHLCAVGGHHDDERIDSAPSQLIVF